MPFQLLGKGDHLDVLLSDILFELLEFELGLSELPGLQIFHGLVDLRLAVQFRLDDLVLLRKLHMRVFDHAFQLGALHRLAVLVRILHVHDDRVADGSQLGVGRSSLAVFGVRREALPSGFDLRDAAVHFLLEFGLEALVDILGDFESLCLS